MEIEIIWLIFFKKSDSHYEFGPLYLYSPYCVVLVTLDAGERSSQKEKNNPDNPANKNNRYAIFKELTFKNDRKMTGEKDNSLLHFFFLLLFFAGPPDKLTEALIFDVNFNKVLKVKKSILWTGRLFGIQLFSLELIRKNSERMKFFTLDYNKSELLSFTEMYLYKIFL